MARAILSRDVEAGERLNYTDAIEEQRAIARSPIGRLIRGLF